MAKQSFKSRVAKNVSPRDFGVGLLIWGWLFMVVAAWRDDLTLVAAHGLVMVVGAVLTLHPRRQPPVAHIHIQSDGLDAADITKRAHAARSAFYNIPSK